MSTVRRAYVEVAGLQVHYREAGTSNLPTLLLLHQSPSTSAMYELLMHELQQTFHLLAPDTPGFGGSDSLPDDGVSIGAYAKVMRGFLQALDVNSCAIFGHHTGAGIAVQLEYDFPGVAAAMALSGPPLLSPEQQKSLPAMASPFEQTEDGGHLLQMWQRIRAKDIEAPLALSQREVLSALASGDAYQASYSAVAAQNFSQQLPALDCPVLAFAGNADVLHSSVAPTLELLRTGSTVSLPGGEKTYVCERQVTLVARILKEFFTCNLEIGNESGSK